MIEQNKLEKGIAEGTAEGIAEWLEKYSPKHKTTDSGWLIVPEVAKERYRQDAKEFLAFLDSQIGGMALKYITRTRFVDGYNKAIQDILSKLQSS